MSKLLYFLATFAESGLSVLGLRGSYEQPSYTVVQQLAPNIEIRAYPPRTVAQTPIREGRQGEAFERLFRYITGANTTRQRVNMTVEQTARLIPMTVPVEITAADPMMRFYLPPAVVQAVSPTPTDPLVQVVSLPPAMLAVIRYSGTATDATRAAETALLSASLKRAGKRADGPPLYFSYDPPFTPPFLRRNEVALPLASTP
jgi:hypothetical protein